MLKNGDCAENGINPKAVYDFLERCERDNLGVNSFMLVKGTLYEFFGISASRKN